MTAAAVYAAAAWMSVMVQWRMMRILSKMPHQDGRQTDSIGWRQHDVRVCRPAPPLRETQQAGLAGQFPHRPGDGILLAKLISLHAETTYM